MRLFLRPVFVTLDVLYYIPRTTILSEFIWQTEDREPEFPRIHKFLDHWRNNIDAVISEVLLATSHDSGWRRVDYSLDK